MSRRLVFYGLALAIATACGEPVEPASRLERPRVLGAVTSLPSDAANAAPGPNDTVRVAIVTASKDAVRGAFASHAFRVCPSNLGSTDYVCGGPELPFREEATGRDPVFLVDPLRSMGEVALFGVLCATGTATFDRASPSFRGACDDGSHPAELVARVVVGGPANKNPFFGDDAIKLDDTVLGPVERTGCDGTAPMRVRADGQKHTVVFSVPAGGLEPGETPLVSHFATHGKLEHLYSTLDDGNAVNVSWESASELGLPRETARFHAVLRDGRGGVATSFAAFCLER